MDSNSPNRLPAASGLAAASSSRPKALALPPASARAIAAQSGLAQPQVLADCVRAAGFDVDEYLRRNPGLMDAGFGPAGGLGHFLEHGYAEARDPPFGPLPDGLTRLAALAIPNRAYARALFRTMFLSKARHPDTAERIWAGIDPAVFAAVRGMGGLPYVVFGDSHANHFLRACVAGEDWLAGMALVCHGASAAGLASDATAQHGSAILSWARVSGAAADVPVVLVFGGIDAEFRWMEHRLRDGIGRYDEAQFAAYATRSVKRYGAFLQTLAGSVGAGRLRVCAVFPTTLSDRNWVSAFLNATGGPDEPPAERRRAVLRLEIPDWRTRTRLRALYNRLLSDTCADLGVPFVDIFTPFLGADGPIDPRFLPADRDVDLHLNVDTSGPVLGRLLYAALKQTLHVNGG